MLELTEHRVQVRPQKNESIHLFDQTIRQLRQYIGGDGWITNCFLEQFAEKLIPQTLCKRYERLLSEHSEIGRFALKSRVQHSLSLLVCITYRSPFCHTIKREVIWVSYARGSSGTIALVGSKEHTYDLPRTPEKITDTICEILESLVLRYN